MTSETVDEVAMEHLVLTVIAEDQPGLVERLLNVLRNMMAIGWKAACRVWLVSLQGLCRLPSLF